MTLQCPRLSSSPGCHLNLGPVSEVATVVVWPQPATVQVEQTVQLNATVQDAAGHTIPDLSSWIVWDSSLGSPVVDTIITAGTTT
jgi:hypothetical protein